MSLILRSALLAIPAALAAAPAAAQLSLLDQFTAQSTIVALAYDTASGEIYLHRASATTIDRYDADGTLLGTLARPGESTNDVDMDVLNTAASIAGVAVPAGTLLFANGETGAAELYALDPAMGTVLATLNTAFGQSHVVGAAWHPLRGTLFLLQDKLGGGAANQVAEIDPDTGAVLASFSVATQISVNYGDLEVSESDDRLYIVSSDEATVAVYEPTGAYVTEMALPTGVTSLSGLALDDAGALAWAGSTSVGKVNLVGGALPSPPGLDFGDAPAPFATRYADDGARHRVGSLSLGSLLDHEGDGAPHAKAKGDDNRGNDDEDGLSGSALIIDDNNILTLEASAPGVIDAWVDYNRDGDWHDEGEQVINSSAHPGGSANFAFHTSAGVTAGKSITRVRISSAGGLSPDGLAADGEVEDYQLKVAEPTATISTDTSVTEGAAVTVTVTLNSKLDEAVELAYATVDGGAKAGKDYAATSGTLLIPAGQKTASVQLQTLDDSLVENGENFSIQLSAPVNALISDGKMVISILSDD